MNKHEALKRIEAQKETLIRLTDWAVYVYIKELIKSLDEPEKVVVSEEEAKFLKTFDFNCESDVATALYRVSRVGWGYYLTDNNDIELKDLTEGFRELENRKRLIKAILDGYEVEKEKQYLVSLKNGQPLTKTQSGKALYFNQNIITGNYKFTRKELEEADFGWVFDCPGIEVEEVE